MRAIFKSVWVRKLTGKLGVPCNRRLRVRGSPHPFNYVADLSLPAAESNAFRSQSDFPNFACYNFCKTNRAIRMTPAQAAGVEKKDAKGKK
jgi:hypothetical protein